MRAKWSEFPTIFQITLNNQSMDPARLRRYGVAPKPHHTPLPMAGPLKNQRHETFVLGVFQGKAAYQAYMDAGYKTTAEAARRSSSDLLTKPDIQGRLEELKAGVSEKVIESSALNKEIIVSAVHRLAKKAEDLGQIANAKACWELLGREHGTFVERRIVTVRRLADLDMDELQELAAYGADGRRTGGDAANRGRGRPN